MTGLTIGGLVLAAMVATPRAASAQSPVPFSPAAPGATQGKPVILLGADAGASQRAAGFVGVWVPMWNRLTRTPSVAAPRRGLEVMGSAGAGGFGIAAGPMSVVSEGWAMTVAADVRGTLTRTSNSPRDATPRATYVGADAGMVLTVIKFDVGIAHRVSGPTGPKAMIFTWRVGVQIPVGW